MEYDEYRRMYEEEDRYWWFLAKRALVRSFLQRYASFPSAVALDVGCGTGGTLQAFSSLGGLWVGADRSDLGLLFCRKRGLRRVLQASAEALPVRTDIADLLLCLDVLYHRGVPDDRAVLAECFRVLRPGGMAVITDSALEWLRGPHDEAVHARKRYRLKELSELVRGSGLQIVRRSYMNGLLFLPMAAYRLWRRWFPGHASGSDILALPRPVDAILGAVMRVERGILQWIDLPIGTSVIVVARKP